MPRRLSASRPLRLAGLALAGTAIGLTGATAATSVQAAATTTKTTTTKTTTPAGHSILASRRLWATVDVCNPADQKDTIGVRGSMPGDGATNETMFMRFRIQYRDAKTRDWMYISANADSGYVNVGSSSFRAREAGRSFVFRPVAGTPAYRLRGVVLFQWRRGTTVVRSASRYTTGGHIAAAGADPKNYSASTCIIS